MISTTFNGCFGWIYPGRGSTGIVLCAAFGHENMIAHHGWRKLAEMLASRGYHVLRFDYLSTGDSIGTEDDPCQVDRWKESVVSAARHLISTSGSQHVILIGLRLGATLALLASKDIPEVDGVACLAPILIGKTYIRELRLRANAWREANLHISNYVKTEYLDVLGERLSEDTLHDLSKINLGIFQSSLKELLIVSPKEEPATSIFAENLRSQGCRVVVEDFCGYADYLEDSIASVVPHKAFEKVGNWCSKITAPYKNHIYQDQIITRDVTLNVNVEKGVFVERGVDVDRSGNIFGILCLPHQAHNDDRVVIMLNTGFGRHTGDGRIFTMLARRLAQLGIASLRLDLGGFGDSKIRDHQVNPYSASPSADVGAALTFLQNSGYGKATLVGVCSGAFNAFHAALDDNRVHGLIMVNTQHFVWKSGSSLKVENRRQRRPINFYIRAMGQLQVWRRLIQGQVAIMSILFALFKRPWTSVISKSMLFIENATGIETSIGQVNRWFAYLAARGVKVELLYSACDPGLEKLSFHSGKKGRTFRKLKEVNVSVIKNADHALFDYSARCHVVDKVIYFMERNTT